MEKSIKAGLQKIRSKTFLVFLLAINFQIPNSFAYKDQIVIEMPNSAKTTYDIRVHSFIRNLYDRGIVIDPNSKEWLASFFEDERKNYIEQYFAQIYVLDNDIKLKPSPEDVKAGINRVEKLFSSSQERAAALKKLDINDTDVSQWVVHRLMLDNFLNQTIRDRVVITDQKLMEHYQAWKTTRFLNRNYDDVAARVREDLFQTLQAEEFEKWVDQEKRRQKMILKVVSST
ncbi:MAG: hypothetical protein R2877_05495 [Bdellovibrionota bacterium]